MSTGNTTTSTAGIMTTPVEPSATTTQVQTTTTCIRCSSQKRRCQ